MNCLGVDFGTTSVKAVLFDENLHEIASSTKEYTLHTSGDRVELPGEKYWEFLQAALDEVGGIAAIDCLAIDTQCETLILTDEYGRLTNPYQIPVIYTRSDLREDYPDWELGGQWPALHTYRLYGYVIETK